MDRRLYALGPLLAAVVWGGMYVVSKWGFASIPPVTLTFLRLALGAVILLAVVRVTKPRRSFSRAEWVRFGALGVLVTASLVTQFVGTDLTNASQGSLLTVLTPLFTLLLGVSVLGESLTRRRLVGMALAVVGTLAVLAGQYDLRAMAAGSLLGVGLLLATSLTWAGYTVWGTPLVRRYSALETATYSTAFAVPLAGLLVPVEVALDPRTVVVTPATVAAVVYLGAVSTALAWYAWYKGLEYVDAGTVAVFFFAQPVVGAGLGALLLGESLGPAFVAGGAITALGVYIVSTDPVSISAES